MTDPTKLEGTQIASSQVTLNYTILPAAIYADTTGIEKYLIEDASYAVPATFVDPASPAVVPVRPIEVQPA